MEDVYANFSKFMNLIHAFRHPQDHSYPLIQRKIDIEIYRNTDNILVIFDIPLLNK